MASSRKSRRRKNSGGGGKFFLAVALLGGAGYAAWSLFGADADVPDTPPTQAQSILGVDVVMAEALSAKARDAAAASLPTPTAPGSADVDALLATIKADIEGKKVAERHAALLAGYRRLAGMLEQPLDVETRRRTLPLFHAMTDELFFSNIRNEFSEDYIVKPGDSIDKIARRGGVTQELLCRWNGIAWNDRKLIRVGDSFKIAKERPRIVVDKSDFRLSYYFGPNLARQYIIAHGKGNNTPEGTASIDSKIVDPEHDAFAGELQREMVARWIGFSNINGRTGFGIHGTRYPESIPGETSRGCIRMYPEDAIELYAWTPFGAAITIEA